MVNFDFLNNGIRSSSQFNGQAITSDESAETVGKETPGIPKKLSTIGCDQSEILKVAIAITTDAPTPKKTFLVTKYTITPTIAIW